MMDLDDALRARRKDGTGCGGYAYRVLKGDIPTSRLVRLSCERHLTDILSGSKRGLRWSKKRANHIFTLFDKLLRLPSDDSLPFTLLPWERFVLGNLFGWEDQDGYRRYREAYVEVPKGNGKSPLAGGVGLYMLTSDGEPQPLVYTCGPVKDQGKLSWNSARLMVESLKRRFPRMRKGLEVHTSSLTISTHDGQFSVVSGEAGTKDGPIIHCAIVDEVHEHKDGETIRKMEAGFKTRKQPLLLEITNSGSDMSSIAWAHHERARRILEGAITNDSVFGYIAGVDPGDNPFEDSTLWAKSNPSLGHTITTKYIRKRIESADTPQARANVARLNFGIWTRAESPLFDMDGWARGQSDGWLDEQEGEDMWIGCDMASVSDLASVTAIFRHGKKLRVMSVSATPEQTLRKLEDKLEVPLREWVDRGWLIACKGDRIDPRVIRDVVMGWDRKYTIRRFGFDLAGIGSLEAELAEELGWVADQYFAVRQSFLGMTWATKEIQAEVRGGRVDAMGNQLLTWQMGNVDIEEDKTENIRPVKTDPKKKIDAAVALIIAREAARVDDPEFAEYDASDSNVEDDYDEDDMSAISSEVDLFDDDGEGEAWDW